MSRPFPLTTFVFGPRNPQGRDFQVLARSGSIGHLPANAQGVISDIPLLLSAWGSSDESSALFAVALDPIQSTWLLVRAALLGRSGIGVRTFGHGILVGPVGNEQLPRFDRLIGLIPPPDGSQTFGAEPIYVSADDLSEPPGASAKQDFWKGLDLAWRDRLVLRPQTGRWPASLEMLIQSALASIEPRSQLTRIRGWSSSAAMKAVARLDPQSVFSLVLADKPESVANYPRHLTFRLGQPDNPRVEPPASFAVWESLRRELEHSIDPALSAYRLPWHASDSGLERSDAPLELLYRTSKSLDGRAMMFLIQSLLRGHAAHEWRPACSAIFFAMIGHAPDDRAAPWFLTQAARFARLEREALFANGWTGITSTAISALSPETFQALSEVGLLKALPGLADFEAYIAAAPKWQIVSLVGAVSRVDVREGLDDDRLARLLERIGEGDSTEGSRELSNAIVELVRHGRGLAAGRALSSKALATMRPLSSMDLAATARALRCAMREVNGRSRMQRGRLRTVHAALTLLSYSDRNLPITEKQLP